MTVYYISHHGIEGQRWGVRNGPPYPLQLNRTKIEGFERIKDKPSLNVNLRYSDLTVPKGTITSRLSLTPVENVKNVRKYISLTSEPEDKWVTMFEKGYNEQLYVHKYSVNKKMKVASMDNAVKGLYDWVNSSENPRELVRGLARFTLDWERELGFNAGEGMSNRFFWCIGAINEYTKDYFKFMKKQGYDAIADVYGIKSGGDKSIIVIDPDKDLKFLGSKAVNRR